MSDTLRDQLLGLGFKPAPKPERPAMPARSEAPRNGRPAHSQSARANSPQGHTAARTATPRRDAERQRPPRSGGSEMDLAKAYAIRAQKEKDERIAAELARQQEAQRRREGKLKLAELLKTASLNDATGEIARHFDYGGKIRRVYVTAQQLKALNVGALAVVQQGGRYHVLTLDDAHTANELLPGVLALMVDPNAPPEEDVYADPKYLVPDDLVW